MIVRHTPSILSLSTFAALGILAFGCTETGSAELEHVASGEDELSRCPG